MTQEEFAEYMCVTRQSVSKWETDKTYPDVEKLIKIAELYNVTLDYLVRGQEGEAITTDVSSSSIDATTDVSDSSIDSSIDVSDDTISEQKNPKRKLGLKLCLGISSVFIVFSIAMIIMFLIQNPWFHSDIFEQSAKVEKVYTQISVAEVSYENENGDKLTELIMLDTANVRQGDYINSFTNESGDLFIDYGIGLIAVVVVFMLLNMFVVFVLVKELTKS